MRIFVVCYCSAFFCTLMDHSYNSKFGPAAQTPAQRTRVMHQMQQALPSLTKQFKAQSALCAQYISGELSWEQLRQQLAAKDS